MTITTFLFDVSGEGRLHHAPFEMPALGDTATHCAHCGRGEGCNCSYLPAASTTLDAAPEAPHPHLQGIENAPDPVIPVADPEFWCVTTAGGDIFGPYLTEAAAQSLVDELGTGHVVVMELR